MRFIKIYRSLFLIALAIIVLDQVSKELVRTYIPLNNYWVPWEWMAPFARLVHISNTGVAFGLFQGMGTVFAILAMIVSVAIIIYYPRVPTDDWTLRLAMGLQLAGALGNLIDRLVFGYVTDFISVGNFAVFNVADSSITIGVGVLLLGIWLQERRAKQQAPEPAPVETAPVEHPGEETPKQ